MSSVDQRIVEMRFDNKQFESGVSTTLSTLDKLKQALKLSDAGKGLDNLSSKADKFQLNGIQTAVETVSDRFSTLGIIGMTALQNITNKAIDAGERIAKALTLDPVTTGFNEYELKMDSIKTMLSNTNGKNSLDEIKDVLEGLNKYADDTIYNFGQMTSAMGKMTAQGIDLYDAEEAVRGLSNLAALVGSGSQEYTNAMNYGLTQALAMGELRLQDWKSFENANISSKVFRDELIKTAQDLGYFGREWEDNTGHAITGVNLLEEASEHFRETLKYGWVDNDVLLTTLSKFADTTTELGQKAQDAAREVRTVTKLKDALLESLQSGWANTWEYIIGDVNEATEVLTKISDALSSIFNKAADERNEAFKKWHDNPIDGRSTFISAFEKIWGYFTQILKAFDHAKEMVFGNDALLNLLTNITHWLDDFAYNLDWTEKKAMTLQGIFGGAMSVVDIFLNTFSALWRTIKPLLEPVKSILEGIFGVFGRIGNKLIAFNQQMKATDGYYKGFQNLLNVIKALLSPISSLVKKLLGINESSSLKDFLVTSTKFKSLKGIFDSAKEGISNFFKAFASAELLNFEKVTGVFEKFSNVLATIARVAKSALSKAITIIQDLFKTIASRFKGLDAGDTASLFNAGTLLLLVYQPAKTLFDKIKDLVDSGKSIADSFVGILDGVRDCLKSFQEQLKAKVLKTIATAVGILAASLVALTLVDQEKLANGILAIGALTTELLIAMKAMTMLGFDKKSIGIISSIAKSMVTLSLSVLILSGSMSKLASLSWQEIAKGLVGVAGLCLELVGISVLLDKSKAKMVKGSLGLILFAEAIKILAGVVQKLGEVDAGDLLKGLLSIGALLVELSLFLTATDFNGFGMLKGAGLLLVATSLKVLSNVLKTISEIDGEKMINSLLSIGIILTELGIFLTATDFNGFGMLKGAGLLLVATSLTVLASVIKKLGELSTGAMVQGIAGIGGSLLIVSMGLNSMTGTLGGSAALLVASVSLTVLSGAIKKLGSLSIGTIVKGLLALAGAMAVIGVAGMLLSQVAIPIAIASGVMLLFSAAIAAVGAGLLVLSTGMTALSVALPALASGIVTTLQIIASGVPTIISTFITSILEGIKAIGGSLFSIIEGIVTWILEKIGLVFNWIIENGPSIFSWIIEKVSEIGGWLRDNIPVFIGWLRDRAVEIGSNIIDNIGKIPGMIVEKFGEFKERGGEIISNIISGITSKKDALIESAKTAIGNWVSGIAQKVELLISSGKEIVSNIISGIKQKFIDIINSAKELVQKLINGITELATDIKNGGIDIVNKIIEGIGSMAASFAISVKNMVLSGINSIVTDLGDAITNVGSSIANGIGNGISNGVGVVKNAAISVGGAALNGIKGILHINSPSKAFEEVGEFSILGLVNGFVKNANKFISAGENTASDMVEAVKKPLSLINDVLSVDIDATPTIAPIMDLTNIDSGINEINSLADRTNLLFGSATVANVKGVSSISSNPVQTSIDGLRGDIGDLNSTLRSSMSGENMNLLNDMVTLMNRYFPEFAARQVVLDSGEMVGVMTPQISAQMRAIANRSR